MFSTGTGFVPFAILSRDVETYEKFEEMIATHTWREVAELNHSQEMVVSVKNDLLRAEFAVGRRWYATTLLEDYPFMGRITDLIATGKVTIDSGLPPTGSAANSDMICGSMGMLKDTKAKLEGSGLVEGSNSKPSTLVVERP